MPTEEKRFKRKKATSAPKWKWKLFFFFWVRLWREKKTDLSFLSNRHLNMVIFGQLVKLNVLKLIYLQKYFCKLKYSIKDSLSTITHPWAYYGRCRFRCLAQGHFDMWKHWWSLYQLSYPKVSLFLLHVAVKACCSLVLICFTSKDNPQIFVKYVFLNYWVSLVNIIGEGWWIAVDSDR